MTKECLLPRVEELLRYEPETGYLIWRVSKGRMRAGKVAGSITDQGYVSVAIDNLGHSAHRLIWLLVYRTLPPYLIDHIDGNRRNNKLDNLRAVTSAENQQNRRGASSRTSTGLLGVRKHKQSSKFSAHIKFDGQCHRLGSFDTAEAAYDAYLAAKERLHKFANIDVLRAAIQAPSGQANNKESTP